MPHTFASAVPVSIVSFHPRLAALFFAALTPALATGAVTNPPAADLPPDLAALLKPPSPWGVSASVETSFGFKDNLLLSSSGEERSSFARSRAELVLLRLPTGAFDFSMLTEASGTRYFTGQSTKHDARAFVFSDVGWNPHKSLRGALQLIGYYRDEVSDGSLTDFRRDLTVIKVSGANVGPVVRWTFHPSWWIEAQGGIERKVFRDGAEDCDIGEGALRLGWKPNDRLKLRVAAERRWRDYVERFGLTSIGRELTTLLKISERKAALLVDFTWDRAGRWKSSARAGALAYRDNASGYLNFGQRFIGHELEWKTDAWLLRLGGTARRTDYDVQKVGFGSPPPLIRDDFDAEFHTERRIAKHWTLLAKYRWERSRSNDTIASYVMNEGLLGLRWNWDK